MIRPRKFHFLIVTILLLIILTSGVILAGGGAEGALSHRVSTVGLDGINKFVVDMYNDNRLLLAFLTTLTMGLVGVIIAFITDIILKFFGLEVTKIEHRE